MTARDYITSLHLPSLHHAAIYGNNKKVKQYLAAGDPIEAQDDVDGFTPLLAAVDGNQSTTVKLLLATGANPNTRDRKGYFPLYCAAQNGNVVIAKDLL